MDGERRYHHGNLAQALVSEALSLIEGEGIAALSLRAVAKRAAVSPAAVYRHFADKEALLAAVAAEGFAALNAAFADVPAAPPADRLAGLGEAYVAFALAHPGLFRLMFTAARPSARQHARLQEESHRAFASLTEAVTACRAGTVPSPAATIAAWSLVHGLALLRLEGQLDHWPPEAFPDTAAVLSHLVP